MWGDCLLITPIILGGTIVKEMKRMVKKEYWYLNILLWVLMIFSLIGLAGCSSNEITDDRQEDIQAKNIVIEDYSSEIDSWGTDTMVIGTVKHGIRREEIEELERDGYITYRGEEMKIPYKALATGKATNLGFLLFIDGRPQAYSIDDFEEYTYCHVFEMEEDVEKSFDFCFSPSVGEKGKIQELTILSIYYPNFIPDMKQTSSYGMYHQTLEVACDIKMEANPLINEKQMITDGMLNNIFVDEMEITQDYLMGPIIQQYGMQEITQEALDNNIFNLVLFEGKYYTDNYLLTSDSFKITFEMCGKDGTEYYVTPYINHVPVCDAQLVTVRKGKVRSLTYNFDIAALDNFQTFYFIAIPINNENFLQIKTSSILLYKEEKSQ